jgi:hypothetical protein
MTGTFHQYTIIAVGTTTYYKTKCSVFFSNGKFEQSDRKTERRESEDGALDEVCTYFQNKEKILQKSDNFENC